MSVMDVEDDMEDEQVGRGAGGVASKKRDNYWGRGAAGLDDAVSYWTNKQTVLTQTPLTVARLQEVIYYIPKGCNSGKLWTLCQAVAEKNVDDVKDPGWGIVCCNTCNKFLRRPVATGNFDAHAQSSSCNPAKRKSDLMSSSIVRLQSTLKDSHAKTWQVQLNEAVALFVAIESMPLKTVTSSRFRKILNLASNISTSKLTYMSEDQLSHTLEKV